MAEKCANALYGSFRPLPLKLCMCIEDEKTCSQILQDGLPAVAVSMGQDTIDMLSKAKMRYVSLDTVFTTT